MGLWKVTIFKARCSMQCSCSAIKRWDFEDFASFHNFQRWDFEVFAGFHNVYCFTLPCASYKLYSAVRQLYQWNRAIISSSFWSRLTLLLTKPLLLTQPDTVNCPAPLIYSWMGKLWFTHGWVNSLTCIALIPSTFSTSTAQSCFKMRAILTLSFPGVQQKFGSSLGPI